MKTATIQRILKGKQRGQFTFVLKAANGETIAISEAYTQKHNAIKIVETHFNEFRIIDNSNQLAECVIVDDLD